MNTNKHEFIRGSETGKPVRVYLRGEDNVGSDNLDSYHHIIYYELRHYKKSARLFRCYVNPSDPSEAVLYRDLRYVKILGLLGMGLLFSAPGLAFIIFSLRESKKKKERSRYSDIRQSR